MKPTTLTRFVLLILAALLALPLAPTAPPVEAKKRPRTVIRTFSNAAPITLPKTSTVDPVAADPYPSTIAVGGLKGKIRDVNLTLNGFDHTYRGEVRLLLVGPRGQTAIVMANVGTANDADDATLRLDDEAEEGIPSADTLRSGAYRPTYAYKDIPFVFEAPAPPLTIANAALAVFDGANPNGSWRLFVQDAYGFDFPGAFQGGWALEITTKIKAKKK